MEEIKELIKKIKYQDNQAFEVLYEMFKKDVFFAAYSILKNSNAAEDILQETFMSFLDHIDRVKEDVNPRNYLITISRNKAISYYRKHKREIHLDQYENEGVYGFVEHKEDNTLFLMKEMEKILKPKEFQIVIMHVVNGLTHKEIAKLHQRPLGTITWAYNNAIKKLQKELKVDEGKTR